MARLMGRSFKLYSYDYGNPFRLLVCDLQLPSPHSHPSLPQSQQHCKMFIGGLHLQTTTDTLKEFFGHWGTITDAIVMRDPGTKRSRGFGFVTYDDPQAVDDCLSAKPHNIDGREVEAKRAVPREENSPTAHTRYVITSSLHHHRHCT